MWHDSVFSGEFGDPAAMARRLWLDAMKGKIMAQRVLIATCLVVTLASLSLVGGRLDPVQPRGRRDEPKRIGNSPRR